MKILFYRLLRKLKILKFLNLKVIVKINSKPVVIPINAGIGFDNLYISEPWMISILEMLDIPDKSVFIDVGVNIGQTLLKFKSVYSNVDYIGFEPNPTCVYYVENLIEANSWESISLVPTGIAEKSGIVVLNHYSDNVTDSSASIISNYRAGEVVYKREIVTILDVKKIKKIWKSKNVSLIKIDVEGAEFGVIKSFLSTIKKHQPYLIVEVLPVYDNQNTVRLSNQIEIEKMLAEINYKIYRIIKTKNNTLHELEKLETIEIHKNLDWCDYIFSPKEIEYK